MEDDAQFSLHSENEIKCIEIDSNLEENEARLRKKLLEKQQKKNDSRLSTTIDDEEMFTIQPDFQETKKKEVLKLSEKSKDYDEKEKQKEKDKERSLRRPIEWKTKDDRLVASKSKVCFIFKKFKKNFKLFIFRNKFV